MGEVKLSVKSKVCTVCKEDKLLEEYNRQKLGKYGRRASCRVCQNKANKEWKQTRSGVESRKRYKSSKAGKLASKRYRENNKDKIKAYQQTDNYKINRAKQRDKKRFGGNREVVLKRDNYQCVRCGSKEYIQVHHIDWNGRNKELPNNNINNLETLCGKCHVLEHKPRMKK